MNGVIIGAGIGGLSTAIALEAEGIDVHIYEMAGEIKPVGAGILIPPNAMTVLDHYNLAGKIKALGHSINSFQIIAHQGKVISTNASIHTNNKVRYPTIAIHRADLQKTLFNALNSKKIYLDHQYKETEKTTHGVKVTFTNGHQCKSDFLIGADGIRSAVRQSIIPNSQLRDAKQFCWRGIADITLPKQWQSQLSELWGTGSRFGFVQLSPNHVYWYGTINQNCAEKNEPDNLHNNLLDIFSDYIDPVKEIIKETPQQSIIGDPIYDLSPLKQWSKNRVILTGDAAHAVTPNLGQGGAQAIEDAYVLAKKLFKHNDLTTAFNEFQSARKPKVNRISKMSWQIGQMTNWSYPYLCFARNQLLRSTSQLIANNPSKMLYEFDLNA